MENNEYSLFLEKQNDIYKNSFSGEDLREGGSKPSKIVLNPIGEYLIAIRHPEHVNEKIAGFVERINAEVPSVKYAAEDLHTTITTTDQTPVEFVEDFNPNKKLLEKLVASASGVSNLPGPAMQYNGWAFNNNTIIVKGIPSYHFIDIAERVVDKGKEQGLELRMPWGAHITATRFSEELSPKELQDFFKLMEETPTLTPGNASWLDVGYITLNKDEFKFNPAVRSRLD